MEEEISLGMTLGLTSWLRAGLGQVRRTCPETPDTQGGQVGAAVIRKKENPPPDFAHP